MATTSLQEVEMLTRKEIETRAQEALQLVNTSSLPIDPVSLANAAGIKVHTAEFSNNNLSGMISKRGPETVILVKQTDPDSRKRFTIAHELGHHFLHLTDQEDGAFVDDTINLFREQFQDSVPQAHRKQETEANRFAAALLMPEPLIRREFAQNPDIDYLAWRFGVSEQAMGYRIAELGLR
ncbi:ImmA/IrrE family metallo-endopeptidase [Hymenobacter weizhouensis]|uniref:ImmA/IrrE family metallo-endopeptidase n=1 Tax=Hymenobacter sp. YIM 151500-1 TaxID=2987689 RepID=UPI0022275D23|nr:ImmA/IrrE family metallo-endopeptidase [Hymenobacter sp. YIM 151500-1]UYZ61596.1 ImmA/IrrE family metallo-endopeptidase [Hymenobacter sp. YIM 151500-1]